MPRKRKRSKNRGQSAGSNQAAVGSTAERLARDYNDAVAEDPSFMDDEGWFRPRRLQQRMSEMERLCRDYWLSSEELPEDPDDECATILIYKFEDGSIGVVSAAFGSYETCHHFSPGHFWPIPAWVSGAMSRADYRTTKHPDNQHIVHRDKGTSHVRVEHDRNVSMSELIDCPIGCIERFANKWQPPSEWLAQLPE